MIPERIPLTLRAGIQPHLAPVVLGLVPRAIIRRVEHQRVVTQPQLVERVQQAPRLVIKLLHDIAVEPSVRLAFESRRGINNGVHHRVRQVEYERLARIAAFFQPVDGLVRVHADQAGHVCSLPRRLIVLVERDPAIIVGAKRTEVVIEPLRQRHAFNNRLAVGDVPLPDANRLVAYRPDQLGKCNLGSGHRPPFAAGRVAAGQQRRSRRSTDRLRVETGEERPLFSESVQPGCLVLRVSVAGQIGIALVIGEDDQDIGFQRRPHSNRSDHESCNHRQESKTYAHQWVSLVRVMKSDFPAARVSQCPASRHRQRHG